MTQDLLIINGEINNILLNTIAEKISYKKSDQLKLVLTTNGGDPHAGFKISRYLQSKYSKGYIQCVIDRCKSAGTLIACGASEIMFFNPYAELGPLDMQRVKNEDLNSSQYSSLNIFKFLDYVSRESVRHFTSNFIQLKGIGLSIKSASEVCSNIVQSIYEPICRQIDPLQVGDMSRSLEIAKTYMINLNINQNLHPHSIEKLIYNYPDHNFVIDFIEAKSLFIRINEFTPSTDELNLYKNNQFLFIPYEEPKTN